MGWDGSPPLGQITIHEANASSGIVPRPRPGGSSSMRARLFFTALGRQPTTKATYHKGTRPVKVSYFGMLDRSAS